MNTPSLLLGALFDYDGSDIPFLTIQLSPTLIQLQIFNMRRSHPTNPTRFLVIAEMINLN
jgi:hypothetical protein